MDEIDQVCKDCGVNKIFNSEDDLKWWKDMVAKAQAQGDDKSLPKRCKSCRLKKKARNNTH